MRQSLGDDVESRLRELFERQAAGLTPSAHGGPDAPAVIDDEVTPRRRSRTALVAAVSVAAAVLVVIGIVAVAPARDGVRVAGSPDAGSTAPVHFETQQVTFDATALHIEANGLAFTSAGSKVDVHSDPGTAGYQTLELIWQEHGVEMRLFMYFAADAHDWWATSMATYNGKAQGDWITYAGERFRTPLGSSFTGTVDLQPTGGHSGHLTITNLRLEAFRRPPVCATQSGAYAIESNEGDRIDLTAAPAPAPAMVGFDGTVTLLDRATCTAVPTPGHFGYRFISSAPEVVSVDGNACPSGVTPPDYCDTHAYFSLTARAPGAAIVHIAALDLRTGTTVAQTDVHITVRH